MTRFGTVFKLALPLLLASQVVQAKEPTWITEKPLDLKIHMHFRNSLFWNEDSPVAKDLTRLTNIRLVQTADKKAKNSQAEFQNLLASNKFPDIVGGDNMKDDFIRYGMEGVFVPLNSLIDKHAPNIKAFLKSHPDVLKAMTAPDGKIYFIPYVPDGKVSRGYFIRQDWLDKLGLKQPQNVAELYTVLKAFREKDPNGNGKKDEIPYFNGNQFEAFRLVNLWGARSSGSNVPMDFYVENGRVKHPFIEVGFKNGIKNVAQWYREGLIDPQIFTRGSKSRQNLFGANTGGMTHDWFASTAGYNDSIPAKVPGFSLLPIAPPADSKGRRWEEDARLNMRPDGWAITLANRYPVETIKYFDFMFTKQGRNITNFGVEGVTWDMQGGKAVFKESVIKGAKPVNNQMWDIGAQIPIGFWQDYDYERQWTNPIAQKGIEMYLKGGYNIPQFPSVNMTKDERAIYDLYWADLQAIMLEHGKAWVTGEKDVDKTWDKYLNQLKFSGLYEVLNVMQAAYQRQYVTKK